MRLLLIKTSSLGDVLQTLPAVSDACRARDDIEIDWVVEAPFAPVPAWHPRVRKVIPVSIRRWRREPRLSEMAALVRELRSRRYDLVIDAQGLMKSALLGLVAKGPVAGLDFASAREGVAAIAYGRRFAVPRDMHAVERTRMLFAAALDYARPIGPADYGLPQTPAPARPRLLMLHGATWASKRWPEEYWSELARRALGAGMEAALRWHDEEEQASAERIAAAAPGTLVLPARRSADAARGDRRGQRRRRQRQRPRSPGRRSRRAGGHGLRLDKARPQRHLWRRADPSGGAIPLLALPQPDLPLSGTGGGEAGLLRQRPAGKGLGCRRGAPQR